MDFHGRWRNQYGSMLLLRQDTDGFLSGEFETALPDSLFFGSAIPIVGVQAGPAISFAFGLERDGTAAVCSFTGRLEKGRLETVWHVATTGKPWPHAVATNADTFEKLEDGSGV